MMTLEQFIATKKHMTWEEAANLLRIDPSWSNPPHALVYADSFFIEDYDQKEYEHDNGLRGQYYLIIGRDDWVDDDLVGLEKIMYAEFVAQEEEEELYNTETAKALDIVDRDFK